jgi:hypothetical protein
MALKKKTVNIGKGKIPKTISEIAKMFNTSVSAIKQANPNIENVNKVRLGQKLVIPSPTTTGTTKNPYKGMTPKMMADMDVKNKDMAKQKEVSRKLGLRGLSPNQNGDKKKPMVMPKPKPKTEIAKKKKVAERLKNLAALSANKNGTTMAMPKPKPKTQTASRTSRRKGRKA